MVRSLEPSDSPTATASGTMQCRHMGTMQLNSADDSDRMKLGQCPSPELKFKTGETLYV